MHSSGRLTRPSRSNVPSSSARQTQRQSLGPSAPSLPHGAGGQPSGQGGVVEREYVYNLQQQVYYLELQGRLLREKLAEPGPKVRSVAVEADPARDPSLDVSAPLNEHIASLKSKYVSQLKENERATEAAKKAQVDAEAIATELRVENETLRREMQHHPHAIEAAREAVRVELHRANLTAEGRSNEISELSRTIAANDQTIQNLQARTKAAEERANALGVRLQEAEDETRRVKGDFCSKTEADRRERELSAARVDLKDSQRRTLELEQGRTSLEDSTSAAKDALWKVEQQNEQQAMQLTMKDRQIASLREDLTRLREEATGLRQERDEAQTRAGESEVRAQSLTDEIQRRDVGERVEAEMARSKLEQAQKEYDARAQSLRASREEVEALRGQVCEYRDRIDVLETSALAKDRDYQAVDAAATEARTSMEDAQARLREEQEVVAVLTEKVSVLEAQQDRNLARMDCLEKELQASESLSGISVEEFEQLRETNMELANTIGRLTSSVSSLGRSKQAFRETQARKREERERGENEGHLSETTRFGQDGMSTL
ncbi:hypothetical protein KIPB_003352 [Kipferlia bialata]|uniref:Uncharacterized protein n=1 Tax=Kipferlia bialata TaxID=797122 RepID=A0A9K3CTA2_9EUKA|nr:hypothetical protein KIPB_003352 [Kipferlia bialata]|eukprot:g3352.t1